MIISAKKNKKIKARSDINELLRSIDDERVLMEKSIRKLTKTKAIARNIIKIVDGKAFLTGDTEGINYISSFISSFYKSMMDTLNYESYNKQQKNTEFTFDLWSGKFLRLNIKPKSQTTQEIVFTATIPLRLIKSLTDVVGKIGISYILQIMLRQFWVNDKMPPVFDLTYKLPTKNKKNGTVILPDGALYYIPEERIDKRKEYFNYIFEHEGSSPKSMSIMYDPLVEEFVFTNSYGGLSTFSVANCMKPLDNHKKSILEQTLREAINITIFRNWNIFNLLDVKVKDLYNNYLNTAVHSIPVADTRKILNNIEKVIEANKSSVVPNTYYSAKGNLKLISDNFTKYKTIANKVDKQFKDFNTFNKDNLGELPSVRKDLVLFPHQAESVAKMKPAGETAILDVATGGGKTIVLLLDMLQLMKEGKVKRPLIVAPNPIIGQWVGAINYFTDGKVNALALMTSTTKNWGRRIKKPEDNLLQQALSAPDNTIFLTSYPYLILDSVETIEGGWIFPNVDFFKDELGVDYVALDESHMIKNSNSQTHRACIQLRPVKYRRLSTGTLVVNTPMDLVGQVAFLDPRALGTDKEFAEKYAAPGGVSSGRGKTRVTKWRASASKEIISQLRNHTFYLQYREKDWIACLPKIKYNYYPVQFTPAQKAEYKKIVEETLADIMSDPRTKDAWLKYLEQKKLDDDGELSVVGAQILAKFAMLEQFLTDPTYSPFIRKSSLPESDKTSPKSPKCDMLMAESFKKDSKCIIATHFKRGATHLLSKSKYKASSLYYDAAHKGNLTRFMTEADVKSIFAVQQSISEGLNLQMADRIIMTDLDWTPGKVKQLIARIYRPLGPKVDTSKVVNIDYLYMDGSADVAKLARLIYKRTFNAKTMEGSPIEPPPPPSFDDSVFFLKQENLAVGGYMEAERNLNKWFSDIAEEQRAKGDFSPIVPKIKGEISGKSIDTPWVVGMSVPLDVEGEPLSVAISAEGFDVENAKEAKDFLIGKYVRTEFGIGVITAVSRSKIRIKYEDGSRTSTSIFTTVLLDQSKFDSLDLAERGKVQKRIVEWKKNDRIVVNPSRDGKEFFIGTVHFVTENEVTVKYDNGKIEKFQLDSKALKGRGIDETNEDVIERSELKKWLFKVKKIKIRESKKKKMTMKDFDEGDRLIIKYEQGYYIGTVNKKVSRPSGWQRVYIKLDEGTEIKCRPNSSRIVAPGIDEVNKKQIKPEELDKWSISTLEVEKEVKEIRTSLSLNLINKMFLLTGDSDAADMVSLGFYQYNPFWSLQILSKKDGIEALSKLAKRYKISNIDSLYDSISTLRKDITVRDFKRKLTDSDITKFIKQFFKAKKPKNKKKLFLYFAWIDAKPYLVSQNIEKNLGKLNMGKKRFKKSDASRWYKFIKNISELRKDYGKIVKTIDVENAKYFKFFVNENYSINIK